MNKISKKTFNKYLEEIQENLYEFDNIPEEIDYTDNIIEISSIDDIINFEQEYEDTIVKFFIDNEYSYTDSGKIRALKDFIRQNNISINFNDSLSFYDIVEEFEWGNTSVDNEIIIEKIEQLIESMQEFIEEYRVNDSYMPNMNKVLKNWINEIENMKTTFEDDEY